MADVKQLAQQLVGLTVKEVQELADFLKTEYGIEPAAAAVVVAAAAAVVVAAVAVGCAAAATPTARAARGGGAVDGAARGEVARAVAGDRRARLRALRA